LDLATGRWDGDKNAKRHFALALRSAAPGATRQ